MEQKPKGLNQLCSELSMHGFSHLKSGISNKIKCFWICIIISACLGTGFHLYSLLDLYFQYGYYETLRTRRQPLEMPDISLCNSEAISVYNMRRHMNVSILAMKNVVTALDKWVHSDKWFGHKIDPKYFALFITYATFFDNLDYFDAIKLSTSIDELVVHCLFQNFNCFDVGRFHLYFHNIFGSCYTFRIDKNKFPELKAGPEDGLSIILKGNHQTNFAYDMVNKVTNINGIKVIVHERRTLPAILRNAIDIAPGTSTNIGLVMKKFDRLNVPYDKCYEKMYLGEQDSFIYNEQFCEYFGVFLLAKKICNCTSNQYHFLTKNHRYTENCLYSDFSTASLLSVLNNIECVRLLNKSTRSKELEKCVWPCKQTDYDLYISQTSWPQDSMIEDFIFNFILPLPCESPIRFYYERIMKILPDNSTLHAARNVCHYEEPIGKTVSINDYTQAFRNVLLGYPMDYDHLMNSSLKIEIGNMNSIKDDWIKKYFYRLNIYFSKPTIEMHEQVISFSLTDLLSSVGGVLGLWSGFSLVTLIEIFWIFARLVNSRSPTNNCGGISANKRTPVMEIKKLPDHVVQIHE